MSHRNRPVWKRRTTISKIRNLNVIVWPSSVDIQGETLPPSVMLSEGKKVGDPQNPHWENTDIRITLDKLPKVLLDLQQAYQKAIDLDPGVTSWNLTQDT